MFEDRFEAGKLLVQALLQKKLIKKHQRDSLVLAIPRGGLEVGFQISKEIGIKLDIVVTKKIGAPHNPELALGAVGLHSVFLNEDVISMFGVSKDFVKGQTARLLKEIEEKYKKYEGGKSDLKDKTVIITDDGVATGATMIAAVQYVKTQRPKKIIVAVPVCSQDILDKLQELTEVVCLSTELYMGAVGACYKHFPQVTDEEAIKYLKEINKE